MNQLTRRNFLKVFAGLPALALFKPEVAEVEAEQVEAEAIQADTTVYFASFPEEGAVAWNGEAWARIGSSLEFGPDGSLYISGNFLEETPEELRRRISS